MKSVDCFAPDCDDEPLARAAEIGKGGTVAACLRAAETSGDCPEFVL
jgi:hypothetical protein